MGIIVQTIQLWWKGTTSRHIQMMRDSEYRQQPCGREGRSKAADRQGASQQQEAQVGQEREASIISHVTLAPQSLWRLHQHPPQRPQHQQPSSPAALHCAQRLSGSSWCRARVCHWIAINKGESALKSRESRKNGGGDILSLLFSRNLSTHL